MHTAAGVHAAQHTDMWVAGGSGEEGMGMAGKLRAGSCESQEEEGGGVGEGGLSGAEEAVERAVGRRRAMQQNRGMRWGSSQAAAAAAAARDVLQVGSWGQRWHGACVYCWPVETLAVGFGARRDGPGVGSHVTAAHLSARIGAGPGPRLEWSAGDAEEVRWWLVVDAVLAAVVVAVGRAPHCSAFVAIRVLGFVVVASLDPYITFYIG
ncbi:hypothetical protein PLESTB_001018700 [Pleodorina starrii]|uniref:Uncharacterized protein n=1 Tax=Pleodorina starrii TaxID=330485 RepID=A0A9W6BNW3_9CHLO|nr:hypothetical protein PLESTB_001018700 [Pleodorina starrii]